MCFAMTKAIATRCCDLRFNAVAIFHRFLPLFITFEKWPKWKDNKRKGKGKQKRHPKCESIVRVKGHPPLEWIEVVFTFCVLIFILGSCCGFFFFGFFLMRCTAHDILYIVWCFIVSFAFVCVWGYIILCIISILLWSFCFVVSFLHFSRTDSPNGQSPPSILIASL